MAARATLAEAIEAVRHEAGQSADLAHGDADRAAIIHKINRVQKQLAAQFDWPRRAQRAQVTVPAGDNAAELPDPFRFENIERVALPLDGGALAVLAYGIGAEHLAARPWTDVTARHPVRWQVEPVGDGTVPAAARDRLQIWPACTQDVTLTLEGDGQLARVQRDNDLLAFDLDLVALFVAAEVLASQDDKTASAKMQMAEELRRALLSRQQARQGGAFVLGSGGWPVPRSRPGIDYIP